MDKYLLVFLLVGVVFAAGPETENKKTDATESTHGANANHDASGVTHTRLEQMYHRILKNVHDIESNTALTERQKKQQMEELGQQVRKFVSAVTGVPPQMINHPLPSEEAEKLRQQFLTNVHEIINNHDMTFDEKKERLIAQRTDYATGLKALGQHSQQNPQQHKAAVQKEKVLRSRGHADVMTKLLHNVKLSGANPEEQKRQMKNAMAEEMRMLHAKHGSGGGAARMSHPDYGSAGKASHPSHKKKGQGHTKN